MLPIEDPRNILSQFVDSVSHKISHLKKFSEESL